MLHSCVPPSLFPGVCADPPLLFGPSVLDVVKAHKDSWPFLPKCHYLQKIHSPLTSENTDSFLLLLLELSTRCFILEDICYFYIMAL